MATQHIVEQLSFSRLFNLSEPKRIVRSNTVKGPPLDIRAFDDAQYYIFNFKSNPSTTGLRHHGYIKFLRPRRDDEPLSELPCLVDCTCPDFKFRWAWTNKQRGASRVGRNSLNQAINRAPRITNPSNKPGLCKHVLALKNYIQGLMWDIPKSGLKSSEDVLSNLVKYATKRNAEMPQQMAAAKARDARFAAMKSLTRSGRPQPRPEDLPDIPASEDPDSEPQQGSHIQSDTPELPDTPEQAAKIVPPTLHVKPEKRRRQESRHIEEVDKLCTMISLTKEITAVQSLIEDEQRMQTPPTEGEASHSQALDLLRSIDKGIQTLNSGIQELTADIKTDADESDTTADLNEPEAPQGDQQALAGAEDDAANLEKELGKLGVPQR